MKIAIPLVDGRLNAHFGHSEAFAMIEVDEQSKAIVNKSEHKAPPHEPGLLPRWLHDLGANVVLAGRMGERAEQLFADNGITVVTGAPEEDPDQLATAYLDGTLELGANLCDH